MELERPDLTQLPPHVRAYIEALEAKLARLQAESEPVASESASGPEEPPSHTSVITITEQGQVKRTPRHLYGRQRRGGMGVFGIDAAEADPPVGLVLADDGAGIILLTDQGRAFRLPVAELPETPLNGRGRSILERFPLRADERLALAFPDQPLDGRGAYLILVTRRGQVRRIAAHFLGRSLQPGTVLYNVSEGGPPAAACWSQGDQELFIVTRAGQATRFAERLVPVRGCLGMRVDPQDEVVGVAAIPADGAVFLLSDQGKGTIRLMSGFSAHKSPGAAGKTAMRADQIVGAVPVQEGDDLLILSRLGKVIRFAAAEVPPKEGVVQGVNCMNLRADECVAVAVLPALAAAPA